MSRNANTHDPVVVAVTGRLVTRMTEAQTALAREAAAKRGIPVTEWLRRRIVIRALGRAS